MTGMVKNEWILGNKAQSVTSPLGGALAAQCLEHSWPEDHSSRFPTLIHCLEAERWEDTLRAGHVI